MSYPSGDSSIRSVIIDLLRVLPKCEGHRRAVIRILWNEAAGPIIARHVIIRRCHGNDRIAVEVNDVRWLEHIRDASTLIIERINNALGSLGMRQYFINRMDIYTAPSKPPGTAVRRGKNTPISGRGGREAREEMNSSEYKVPDVVSQQINTLPDGLREEVLGFYKAVRQASGSPDDLSDDSSGDASDDASGAVSDDASGALSDDLAGDSDGDSPKTSPDNLYGSDDSAN